MEEEKLRNWADVVVNHSLQLSEDEKVGIDFHSGADDLADEIKSVAEEAGAETDLLEIDLEQRERFIEDYSSREFRRVADHLLSRYEEMDARVMIRAPLHRIDLDPQRIAEFHEPRAQLVDEILDNTKRVDLEFPTSLTAEESVRGVEGLREMVYRASIIDYDSLSKDAERVENALDSSSSVHVKGPQTSLEFKLGGDERQPVKYLGYENLPGGEVFVAPVKDTVEGEICFDAPVNLNGSLVEDIYFRFQNGELIDYNASEGEEALETLIKTDEGSSHIGEFGIGLNSELDEYTGRSLIDEKRKGTIHIALGDTYEENFRDQYSDRNQSSVHQDFVMEPEEVEIDDTIIL